MRACTGCLAEKPDTEFHRDASKRNGLRADCKACVTDRQRSYRQHREAAVRNYRDSLEAMRDESRDDAQRYQHHENRSDALNRARAYEHALRLLDIWLPTTNNEEMR